MHQPISEATVLKAAEDLSLCLERSIEAVKELLRDGEVLHVDESGLLVQGKLHWLHVACTDRLTHYTVHAKRGHEAMDEAGILAHSPGQPCMTIGNRTSTMKIVVMGSCNAHHLRELQFIDTQYQQPWANDMSELLCEIKAAMEDTLPQATSLPPEWLAAFERRYDEIVREGFDANPLPALPGTEEEGEK